MTSHMESLAFVSAPLLDNEHWLACAVLAIAVARILFRYIIQPYLELREPFRDIPSLPNSHWLLGSAHQVVRNPDFIFCQDHTYNDHADARGRTGFWIVNQRGVILTSAEDCRTVLRGETTKNTPVPVRFLTNRVFGPNAIPIINGQHWLKQRKIIHHSLNPSSLLTMRLHVATVVQTAVHSLKERIRKHERTSSNNAPNSKPRPLVMDIELLAKCIGIDATGLSFLSHEFHCCKTLEIADFVHSFSILLENIYERMQGPHSDLTSWLFWLPADKNIQFNAANEHVRSLMRAFIEKHNTLPYYDPTQDVSGAHMGRRKKDLLDNLAEAQKSKMEKFDMDRFADMVRKRSMHSVSLAFDVLDHFDSHVASVCFRCSSSGSRDTTR